MANEDTFEWLKLIFRTRAGPMEKGGQNFLTALGCNETTDLEKGCLLWFAGDRHGKGPLGA